MGYNFVIQPFHDFRKWENEGYRTRDAHFFEHLRTNSEVDKVIVINRPLSLAERVLKHKRKSYSKGKIIFDENGLAITELDSKTFIIDIFSNDFIKVLIQKRAWWDSVFRSEKTLSKIRRALKQLGIEEFELLVQNPMAVGLFEAFPEQHKIFDTIDNWLEHEQMRNISSIVRKNYNEVDKLADLIISVSANNKKIFPTNTNFKEITNGVDFDKFNIIDGISKGNTPIIGYVGKIQDRFDFELLKKVAELNPNLQFNIYGPLLSGREKANEIEKSKKNVSFMREVAYDKLPRIINTFSVGIIPHTINEFTASMNPLKLYEYLACGVPVVSTGVNGTEKISEDIFIGNNISEFDKGIKKYCSSNALVNSDEVRKSLPSYVSWESKISQLLEFIKY